LTTTNQELAKLDYRLPATGEEEAFIVAVQDTKIKFSREEDIKEVLRLIMVKVGLRANNWPKDEEKVVLLSHIVANYGGHTPKEILLAFEMGIQGKLEVEMNHYENFSCLYFSNVMNAYREWAKQTHRQVVKDKPQIEHQPEKLSDKIMADWYEETAKVHRETKLSPDKSIELLPVMVADWLLERGFLTSLEAYYGEAARRIGLRLYETRNENKGAYKAYREMYDKGEFDGQYRKQIEDLSKKMAMNDYILKTS
jgi:hypothetical protein